MEHVLEVHFASHRARRISEATISAVVLNFTRFRYSLIPRVIIEMSTHMITKTVLSSVTVKPPDVRFLMEHLLRFGHILIRRVPQADNAAIAGSMQDADINCQDSLFFVAQGLPWGQHTED